MSRLYFATDLHGRPRRYEALFDRLRQVPPDLLLLGGDLLPHGFYPTADSVDFFADVFRGGFARLREELGERYPRVYLILGNDDPRVNEAEFDGAPELWTYLHDRVVRDASGLTLLGYNYVPPTPFRLKDWERYDVSRYVDPGCTSPEEGSRSVPVEMHLERFATIKDDLERLSDGVDMSRAVLLAHSPPHNTHLDRAALDGKMVDHVPLDPHVGSIAIRRWIQARQPLLTLHGHVHESTSRTGHWRQQMGRTWMINGASNSPDLCLVEVDTDDVAKASRTLVEPSS